MLKKDINWLFLLIENLFLGIAKMEIVLKLREVLNKYSEDLKKLWVEHIYLFGSYATGNFNEESDIDLLIEWNEAKFSWDIYGIFYDIQQHFDKPLDIGFVSSLRKEIKRDIEEKNNLITVF